MTRRTYVTAAAAALVAIGIGAAFFVLRDGDDDGGLAALSTRGTPIEMAVPERLGTEGGLTGEALLIAERDGIRFLRLPREDGSSCWATGERRSGFWSITNYGCEKGFFRFPDPMRPIMLLGTFGEVASEAQLASYGPFVGFAADGVKRIGVIDAQGRILPVADVVDNVFTGEPPADVKKAVALNAAGEVVWRTPDPPPAE